MTVKERFRRLAKAISDACASWQAFALSLAFVVVWAMLGPVFQYSETWQLVINTGTTIITFLLVFLVMNTQARDTSELRLKLDELILSSKHARNQAIALDDLPQADVQTMQDKIRAEADDTTYISTYNGATTMSETTPTTSTHGTMALRVVLTAYWANSSPSTEVFYLTHYPVYADPASIASLEAAVLALMQAQDGAGTVLDAVFICGDEVEMTADDVTTAGWRMVHGAPAASAPTVPVTSDPTVGSMPVATADPVAVGTVTPGGTD